MPKCNEGNMRLFVFALESGTYAQCAGALCKNDDTHCCLGVACEVYIKAGGELKKALPTECPICGVPHDDSDRRASYDGESGYLPAKVAEWLGILGASKREATGAVDPYLAGKTASWWNDRGGANFTGIAQLFADEYLTTA